MGCSPRSGKCYQTQAKEYYAECPASEPVASPAPALNIVDEVASPKDAPSCEDQWNNLACSGQFGHEECHTCGERIEFLKTAKGGRKTDAQAKASVAKDFISQCGACGPNDDSTKITTEGYTEVFRDDFEGEGAVDTEKWEHVHAGGGFGNNERQFYTNREKNSFVSNLTTVTKEDQKELDTIANNMKAQFNENDLHRKKWGGGIMGIKSQHVMQRREKAIQIEQAKKLGLQIA